MKVILSGIGFTEVRGRLGGSLITTNRYGTCVGNFRMPANPQSPRQSNQRRKFTAVSREWFTGLSEEDRQEWIVAAENPAWEQTPPFGPPYQPSGYELFSIINLGGFDLFFPKVLPPDHASVPTVACTEFIAESGTPPATMSLAFASTQPADTVTKVWATAPLYVGRWNPFKSKYKWLGDFTIDSGSQLIEFGAAYNGIYSGIQAGQKIFTRIYFQDVTTGITTFSQQIFTTVV
jgi:hypothetical protein